jgi:hypothetical protein
LAINIVLPGSVVSEIGRQKSVVSDAVLMVGLNQIIEDALLLDLIAYYPNPKFFTWLGFGSGRWSEA